MSELESVPTETLPEGALFVGPDGVLYQVVMAGSAGFRKAEPWPWPPHGRSVTERPGTVALVPGSLLARNYPVVAKGRPLSTVSRAEILGPADQPLHFGFPSEELAKLAAQLDETLACQSGLTARRARERWLLTDGRRVFRVYHYQTGSRGEQVDLGPRFAEEHIEAVSCAKGPRYWQYIPFWEETLSASVQTTDYGPEPALEPSAKERTMATPQPTHLQPPQKTKHPEVQAITAAVEELEKQAATPATPELHASSPPGEMPTEREETGRHTTSHEHEPTSRVGRRTPAMILSIDIGYGYTKGVGPDGLNFSFPSVIGTAEDIRFATDLIRGGEERPVKYGDWRFFYGEQAILQSRVQSTIFDRSRVHDSTYKMLFVAALVELAKLAPDIKRIQVVTGLPVDFFGDRPDVVKSFEGIYRVAAEQAMDFAVESVFVAPQPFGSLFRELLSENGRIANTDMEGGRIGVIDVGTYTTDFVVADELRYVQRLSGSVRIGWSKVISQVQQALGDRYMLELTPHEVDRAIQAGQAKVRGEPVSLESLIKPAVTDIQTAIVARARDLWGQGTSLDAVLITGGGGPQLYDALHEIYPHANLLRNAFWANAEGLYRLGQRSATFDG